MTDSAIATRGMLRDFTAYLRRPQLVVPAGLRSGWQTLAGLIGFELAVLVVAVLPLVLLWRYAFDLPSPEAFDDIPQQWFLPLTVLIAPVLEECIFRGWLSGRVRALWLLACAIAVGLLGYAAQVHLVGQLTVGVTFLALLVFTPLGWFLLRKKGTPGWFAKAFPAIFYLSLAAFALMHLTNFNSFTVLMLPLVLPQAWIGLMLGYTRMRIGLLGSIAMHITSNGVVIGFGMLVGS